MPCTRFPVFDGCEQLYSSRSIDGLPPDLQHEAVQIVLAEAELVSDHWVVY